MTAASAWRTQFERRNWGRWGTDDERGAPNLLTPERVVSAARLVKEGRVFSLGQALDTETPAPPRRAHMSHTMTRHAAHSAGRRTRANFGDDAVSFSTHTATHVDALAHLWYEERLYNGFPEAAVGDDGARHCGVERLGPIVGRGVLLDVAGAEGVDALDDDVAVTVDDLRRCADRQGIAVRPGDIVLIRTGWWAARANAPDHEFTREPGPDIDAACWLAEQDPAAVGADNFAFEAMPADGDRAFPVHELLLRDCGVPILEGLALDVLACAGVREFFFVAGPLPLVGATASPLNPLAIV